ILPPSLKPGWRQLGVPHGVLDVLMSEVSLQRSGIPPRIRLVESAGVPEHMGVRLDFEPSGLASPVNQLLKVGYGHWRAALGYGQERRPAFGLTVQALQRPQLPAGQWVS